MKRKLIKIKRDLRLAGCFLILTAMNVLYFPEIINIILAAVLGAIAIRLSLPNKKD